jgi:hypothetical protein
MPCEPRYHPPASGEFGVFLCEVGSVVFKGLSPVDQAVNEGPVDSAIHLVREELRGGRSRIKGVIIGQRIQNPLEVRILHFRGDLPRIEGKKPKEKRE